eukprot:TRINITY_DN13731_c0_g1_i1.p1 TRINITY_DN13731_c0_g1~~TRINITY_DN13731_c0_g1_i1.p1  ORF type:complete len:229 (-),score=28.29 TRINITY_DN13731_c0_g1_i1:227-886(-)
MGNNESYKINNNNNNLNECDYCKMETGNFPMFSCGHHICIDCLNDRICDANFFKNKNNNFQSKIFNCGCEISYSQCQNTIKKKDLFFIPGIDVKTLNSKLEDKVVLSESNFHILWKLRNYKRMIKLTNYDGSGEATYVEAPAARLCIKCNFPVVVEQRQVDEKTGCKHCVCPNCKTRFCTLCLRDESVCLHKSPYYFRKCDIPMAPLQTPPGGWNTILT